MVRAEQTDGRQPMKWSSVDWTATEAVVRRIQDRIFRAAKIKRPRLEPDDEQSSCPVLRGLGSGNGARTRLRLRTQPFGSHHARGQGSSKEAPARAVEDCREGQVPCLCQLGDLREDPRHAAG